MILASQAQFGCLSNVIVWDFVDTLALCNLKLLGLEQNRANSTADSKGIICREEEGKQFLT